MSVYITDKDGKLVKVSGSNANFTLPIGSIFSSAIPIEDANVHLLDGSLISQTGLYKTFADLIKSLVASGHNISCSETEFNNDVSATGNCGKFVIDNTAGTIRLPKITTFIQGLTNLTNIGEKVEAGLPNITGNFYNRAGAGYNGAITDADGAFTYNMDSGQGDFSPIATSGSTGYPLSVTSFNADNGATTKGIYGNSDTVQPPATQYPYYIVLAAGYKPSQVVEIDNIVSDVNLKQDKLIANPVALNTTRAGQNDTVIEYYMSSDGNTWYRKWASGWKECGGFKTISSNTPIALPIQFSNVSYNIYLTAQTRDTTILAASYEQKTANSFIVRVDSWNGTFNYHCCGF